MCIRDRWIEVFYILAVVSIGGGVCFAVLGSGETQSFNEYNGGEDENTSTYRKIEEGEEEETTKPPVDKKAGENND